MVLPPSAVIVALSASRCAGVGIGVMGVATAGVVLALPLLLWHQALLILMLAAWARQTFQRVALRRGAQAITEVRLAGNRLIAVRYGTRPLVAGHVRCTSHVGANLTTIVWRPDGAHWSRTVLILPDMLPAEDFRRLRVLLRYARKEDTQGAPASHA